VKKATSSQTPQSGAVENRGSEVFRKVIDQARRQVLLDSDKAANFEHKGIRGDERAAPLAEFLRSRLPDVFAVGKGEIIDCKDNRTGQLDLVIYDRLAARPIAEGGENLLLPCEAVYAIIEVKSVFSAEEARKCLLAAQKVRRLRPFKNRFVDRRSAGARALLEEHRCLYIVFAYTSDLSKAEWLKSELTRLEQAAIETEVDIARIDRIFVADRGILDAGSRVGKQDEAHPEYLFAEFFLHIVNFMGRECARRPPISWEDYALPNRKGWTKIA
jgi:hypothetical protein